MIINSSGMIKIIISLLTFFLCFYFILTGYKELNLYKSKIINKNYKTKELDQIAVDKKNNIIENNELIKKKINDSIQTKNNFSTKDRKVIIIVKKNDTFSKIIDPYFKNIKIKNNIIQTLNKTYDLKNLRIGQQVNLFINKKDIVNKIVIPYDFTTDIVISIINKQVELTKLKLVIDKEIESKKYTITTSIYEDGILNKVPVVILSELIKLYSFDVDFQRDIRVNDQLEFSYEVLYNETRDQVAFGQLKYASLKLQGTLLNYFIFKTDEGYTDYFDLKGKNVKKALMKTPIDGARLSSSYGMRKHPISGYNKMHKGVDFAAPRGTPIYAAGNGVVEFVGRNGGYGKYIRLRHNNSYKTAYAHLSKYKKGLHKGYRVNQGDIIGYVGSTGRSTGPHLHYEIIYQGKQINPMKMKLPPRKTLKGKELERFNLSRKKIYSNFLFNLYE